MPPKGAWPARPPPAATASPWPPVPARAAPTTSSRTWTPPPARSPTPAFCPHPCDPWSAAGVRPASASPSTASTTTERASRIWAPTCLWKLPRRSRSRRPTRKRRLRRRMRRTMPHRTFPSPAPIPAPRPTARYLGSISRRTRFPHRAGAATGSWCAAAASWWPSIWRDGAMRNCPSRRGRATTTISSPRRT